MALAALALAGSHIAMPTLLGRALIKQMLLGAQVGLLLRLGNSSHVFACL